MRLRHVAAKGIFCVESNRTPHNENNCRLFDYLPSLDSKAFYTIAVFHTNACLPCSMVLSLTQVKEHADLGMDTTYNR